MNQKEIDEKPRSKLRGMIFEGGGPAGVAHLGAIEIFEKLDMIKDINYFVGSSAGAIIAVAMACRANSEYLKNKLYSTNFSDFKDKSRWLCKNVKGFLKKYGWYRADVLYDWISKILLELTGNAGITFEEIYEIYGNYLMITVTEINSGTLYLDYLNSPKMEVRMAVKRSSIMPFFFRSDCEVKKVDFNGKKKNVKYFYTDGGLLDNYPIQKLDQYLSKDEVVGFKLMSTHELSDINNSVIHPPKAPENVVEYIKMLYTIMRNQALKIHIDEDDWNRTIKIDIGTVSATDFDLSDDIKDMLVERGRLAATKFLDLTDDL